MTARKAGSAVAERPGTDIAPIQRATLEIDSGDVALPRLYLGQHSSKAVKARLVEPGEFFAAAGAEDGDPNSLGETYGPIHVLGMTKGKSKQVDGELDTWEFDDPNAPDDADTTYRYVVALPEVDEQLPFRWLLARSGASAAKQINLLLIKEVAQGRQPWEIAFRVKRVEKTNNKGDYFVPQVEVVQTTKPADKKKHEANVAVAAALAPLASGAQQPATPAGDQPSI